MSAVIGQRTSSPSAWAVLLLALALAGCGGTPATTAPPDLPDPTEPAATLAPVPTTPPATAPSTASATESNGSMDSGNDWPTEVSVTLSPGQYVDEFADGSFSSSGRSRNCGNFSFDADGFYLGFPSDADGLDIEDVTFSADTLTPGSSTSVFHVEVTISEEAMDGDVRPGTILDTADPRFGAAGTAQLSVADGQRILTVQVADEDGISINLTATCSPV